MAQELAAPPRVLGQQAFRAFIARVRLLDIAPQMRDQGPVAEDSAANVLVVDVKFGALGFAQILPADAQVAMVDEGGAQVEL